MINTQERIARALERIADALERYNRAILCPVVNNDGTARTWENLPLEEPIVKIEGSVSVDGEIFAETSR